MNLNRDQLPLDVARTSQPLRMMSWGEMQVIMVLMVGAVIGFWLWIAGPWILFTRVRDGRSNFPLPYLLGALPLLPFCIWWHVQSLMGLAESLQDGVQPVLLHFARTQLHWPVVLRPFAGLWWLLQAAATVGAGELFSIGARMGPAGGDLAHQALRVGFLFLFAYLSNAYLLCAAASMTANDTVVRAVWRSRLLIDLAIAVVPSVVWLG